MASDEQSFPTAIVPTRPGGFIAHYDALAEQYGDPALTLFTLQRDGDSDMRFKAAAELMQYRHPKLRAETVTHKGAAGAGQVNIQINIGGASTASPLTPPALRADPEMEDLLA
jgi:hypothetical protein